MYIKKLLKKQFIFSLLTLIFIVFVIFGISYAVFEKYAEDSKTHVMTIGDLNINVTNSGVIDLTQESDNYQPMSDSQAMSRNDNIYTFSVENEGTISYKYKVYLENNPSYTTNLLNHQYIRTNLIGKNGTETITTQTFTLGDKSIVNGLREIFTYTINPGETHNYTLRLWIGDPDVYNLPNGAIGKEVHLNIMIDGEADDNKYAYYQEDFEYNGTNGSDGSAQSFTAPYDGEYAIELWGAQGGSGYVKAGTKYDGGNGAYTKGNINLKSGDILYFYVGGVGTSGTTTTTNISYSGGYNGGGNGYGKYYAGGGATDVRLVGGNWNDSSSLYSRIMVAAGGGGASADTGGTGWCRGGAGGGLEGIKAVGATSTNGEYNTWSANGEYGRGSSQISGNAFGIGYNNTTNTSKSGGAGGYYGSSISSGTTTLCACTGGGSSFISGHTGCVAIESSNSTSPRKGINGASCTNSNPDSLCSEHYSGKKFNNTVMIDGAGYKWTNVKGSQLQMPNPTGGNYDLGKGNTGNGYARITYNGNKTVFYASRSGTQETYTASKAGKYKIEAWGAQGGNNAKGGYGAYTSGIIELTANQKLYIHVGGQGGGLEIHNNVNGYNGGGYGAYYNTTGTKTYSGGGATDIRITSGVWNNTTSVNSRIMVAAGGGGGISPTNIRAGYGGGLIGGSGTAVTPSSGTNYNTSTYLPGGGTQTGVGYIYSSLTNKIGSFGGINFKTNYAGNWGGGGGGGYWSGNAGTGNTGSGGSSYISGHTGCVAITSSSSTTARTGTGGATCTTGSTDNLCSVHYSNKKFTSTLMIDGAGYKWTNVKGERVQMPNPNGGFYALGTGHTGNGVVIITYLGN